MEQAVTVTFSKRNGNVVHGARTLCAVCMRALPEFARAMRSTPRGPGARRTAPLKLPCSAPNPLRPHSLSHHSRASLLRQSSRLQSQSLRLSTAMKASCGTLTFPIIFTILIYLHLNGIVCQSNSVNLPNHHVKRKKQQKHFQYFSSLLIQRIDISIYCLAIHVIIIFQIY